MIQQLTSSPITAITFPTSCFETQTDMIKNRQNERKGQNRLGVHQIPMLGTRMALAVECEKVAFQHRKFKEPSTIYAFDRSLEISTPHSSIIGTMESKGGVSRNRRWRKCIRGRQQQKTDARKVGMSSLTQEASAQSYSPNAHASTSGCTSFLCFLHTIVNVETFDYFCRWSQ